MERNLQIKPKDQLYLGNFVVLPEIESIESLRKYSTKYNLSKV